MEELDAVRMPAQPVSSSISTIPAIYYAGGTGISGIAGPSIGGSHYHAISNSTVTSPGINKVIITTANSKISSVVWIRKPNPGLTIVNSYDSNYDQMHGGTVRATIVFTKDNSIIVDGKIYSHDTPDAFNKDIADDAAYIRYLDLLDFRERYNDRLFD